MYANCTDLQHDSKEQNTHIIQGTSCPTGIQLRKKAARILETEQRKRLRDIDKRNSFATSQFLFLVSSMNGRLVTG